MKNENILSNIKYPEELRELKPSDLLLLAKELRQEIIDVVATKEGHLGASLGVVELTVALHYEEIGVHPERISKIKPYVDRYNWNGIDFPIPNNQWKKFEKQNLDIALNVLVVEGEMKIRQAYINKYRVTYNKQ